ncbi:MAG: cytochrome b N-terminal domain-containing protein [Nitrospiraceae bacterium]|nr:cytochrome b N-terminal domain-containing protein [Nitrospiraceae bacterium]
MLRAVWKWFTDKWPYYRVKDALLKEDITGGSNFAYTLGSTLLALFILQIMSGVVQLFYYVPTTDHAYESVSYLRTEVPFGWLVHNMHRWGANAMVLVLALHMVQVYIWGGYKTQLTWLIGVILLLLVMGLSITGATLIWDQSGYWAGEVSTSIAGEVPLIGGLMTIIARGSPVMGQLSLSRFFAFHIWFFAPLLALFIAAHVLSFRHSGIAGPWDERKRTKTEPFWPNQAFKDMIAATTVFFILICLSVFASSSFSGAADPLNTSYIPKPEWNFLFIYQALKYFKGPLEPVGAGAVPAMLILLLAALPFIDRNPERNPMRRPVAMAALVAYAGLIIALTIIGYLSPGIVRLPASALKTGQAQGKKSKKPSIAKQPAAAPKMAGAAKGRQLFRSEGCPACHRINGQGGTIGPELSGETLAGKSKKWIMDQIRNPKSHNPNSIMPSFADLSDSQLSALADYLLSLQQKTAAPPRTIAEAAGAKKAPGVPAAPAAGLKVVPPDSIPQGPAGKASFIIGNAGNGAILFREQCSSCHGPEGRGGIPNPGSESGTVPPLNPIGNVFRNVDVRVFAGNIDKYIQNGATPPGPGPALHMPDFGASNSLTQQEISNIEAYVLQLNGADRAQLQNPGLKPVNFFIIAVILYAVAISALVIMNAGIKRGRK